MFQIGQLEVQKGSANSPQHLLCCGCLQTRGAGGRAVCKGSDSPEFAPCSLFSTRQGPSVRTQSVPRTCPTQTFLLRTEPFPPGTHVLLLCLLPPSLFPVLPAFTLPPDMLSLRLTSGIASSRKSPLIALPSPSAASCGTLLLGSISGLSVFGGGVGVPLDWKPD